MVLRRTVDVFWLGIEVEVEQMYMCIEQGYRLGVLSLLDDGFRSFQQDIDMSVCFDPRSKRRTVPRKHTRKQKGKEMYARFFFVFFYNTYPKSRVQRIKVITRREKSHKTYSTHG